MKILWGPRAGTYVRLYHFFGKLSIQIAIDTYVRTLAKYVNARAVHNLCNAVIAMPNQCDARACPRRAGGGQCCLFAVAQNAEIDGLHLTLFLAGTYVPQSCSIDL